MDVRDLAELRKYLRLTSRTGIPRPGDACLTPTGKLKKRYHPALYLDTSTVIEHSQTSDVFDRYDYLRGHSDLANYLATHASGRSARDYTTMMAVRDAAPASSVTWVTSPLTLIELQGHQAEQGLLYGLHEAIGAKRLMRQGRKSLGDILRRHWDDTLDDPDGPLRALLADTMLDERDDGVADVLVTSLRNFTLTSADFWGTMLWLMSYVQIGAADVLHLCIAKHLGCRYFASFDGDFCRVRDELAKDMRIELISSPQQLLDLLKKNPRST